MEKGQDKQTEHRCHVPLPAEGSDGNPPALSSWEMTGQCDTHPEVGGHPGKRGLSTSSTAQQPPALDYEVDSTAHFCTHSRSSHILEAHLGALWEAQGLYGWVVGASVAKEVLLLSTKAWDGCRRRLMVTPSWLYRTKM